MKKQVRDQAESLRRLVAQQQSASPEAATPVFTLSPYPAPESKISNESQSPVPQTEEPKPNEEMVEIEVPAESPERSAKAILSPPVVDSGTKTASPEVKVENTTTVPEPIALEIPTPPESYPSPLLLKPKRLVTSAETRVIAVTGGKGGVGKSNVACNLGLALGRMHKKVMLLDADLSLANVDVLLGLSPRLNLSHLLAGEKTLEEILLQGPEGMTIVPGGSGIEELSQLPPHKMDCLFQAFTSLTPTPDLLLIDTAAGIHANVMQFLLAADQVLVVTTPEPTAYTDAYALIKALVKHDPAKEIGVLVNMTQDAREATEVIKLMLRICRQMLNISFSNIGYIPRDPVVTQAVCHQQPFLLYAPQSPAAKAVNHIAATILQIDLKNQKSHGLRSFFQRLFRQAPSQPAAASN